MRLEKKKMVKELGAVKQYMYTNILYKGKRTQNGFSLNKWIQYIALNEKE